MLSSRSVGSYSNSIFRLLRKLWNILHWGYTLLVPLSLSSLGRPDSYNNWDRTPMG